MEEKVKFFKWFMFAIVVLIVAVAVLMVVTLILPPGWQLTSEIMTGLAAMILSITLNYWAGVRVSFAEMKSEYKALVNDGSVIILAVIMFLGTCVQLFEIPGLVCSASGLRALSLLVIVAVGGNQLTYVASAQPSDVVEAKYRRNQVG
jgi:hypothetical protein